MPSGSKKRKAVRKKKEKQHNNHPDPSSASTHSRGGDDVKHQDDKDSDVGDLSSPASQDLHSHQNLLTEGEEEEIEKGKNISNLHSVKGLKIENSEEQSIVVEDSVVQVEREFEIEDNSDKKNGRIELDEPARKSYDECSSESSGSNSSSSSSDDESRGIKNSQAVVDIATVVNSLNAADSFSGRSAETILRATIEETGDSIVENFPADLEKNSLTSEKAEVDMSSPANNSVACYVVESVFEENGEKKQSSFEDVGISAAFMDASSEREEEGIIPSVENTVTISDPKECITQETDDRLTPSYSAPRADADNGVEHEKDSGVTEPLLAPAPRPVQTTSWKSCCGLFEVFTGSGR